MKPAYKIVFFFSIGLVIAAALSIAIFGLRFGVDFRGGSMMELVFEKNRPAQDEVSKTLGAINGVKDVVVSSAGDKGMIIRMDEVSEETHQAVLQAVESKFGKVTENRFDSVGPTVGNELKSKSLTAIIVLVLAVTVYIAFVFRKMSKVMSSWAMGLATMVAMIHDVVIPIGIFALLGKYQGVEISAVFVAAILTILGYSISDTVVVFDRVRENVLRFGSKEDFGAIVHKSIMQTLSRSLNTNVTTLLSLIAIFIFGGESIKYFALALIIGIFLGAYSSIFVASPLLVWWSGKKR